MAVGRALALATQDFLLANWAVSRPPPPGQRCMSETRTLIAGETIPAGTIVLMTSGSYSDFGVNGLYRAIADTVVPGRPARYGKPGEMEVDSELLSTMLEEVPFVDVWTE